MEIHSLLLMGIVVVLVFAVIPKAALPVGPSFLSLVSTDVDQPNVDLLFVKALKVRQRGGLRDEHRRSLQMKLHEASSQASSSSSDDDDDKGSSSRNRRIFVQQTILNQQNNRRQQRQQQRQLGKKSSSCTFNQALAMECTLEEFCQELASFSTSQQQQQQPMYIDSDSSTSKTGNSSSSDSSPFYACAGDLNQEWSIVMQEAEVCYYESLSMTQDVYEEETVAAPFDQTLFHPDTDFCWTETSIVEMLQWDSVTLKQTLEVTRPFRHVYQETHHLQPCGSSNSNNNRVEITGGDYCKSCSSAQVDGMTCNSCTSCPVSPLANTRTSQQQQQQQVDCSNIHQSLVSTCHENEDTATIWQSFIDYAGAECTFANLFQGQCTMEMYCTRLNASRQQQNESQSVVTCYGDIHHDWVIKLRHNEVCYYMNDYHEHGIPYNATKFNHVTDYCISTVLRIDLKGNQPVSEEFVYEITRPVDDQGVVREMSQLVPCVKDDMMTSDYMFEKGYCYRGCPEVVIGNKVCTSNCIVCPDGYEALDCSNVDGALIESCSIDKDDNFVEEVVMYFDRQKVSRGDTGTGMDDDDLATFGYGGGLTDVTELTDHSAGAIYGVSLCILAAALATLTLGGNGILNENQKYA